MTLQALLNTGIEHHRQGRLTEAERAYRQVLASDPNQADALHLLGVIASQSGHDAVAISLIAKSIQLHPANAAAHANLGKVLKSQRQLAEAGTALRRATQLDPKLAEAQHLLGLVYHEQGQPEQAISAYELALAAAPASAQVHSDLGVALATIGRREEAVVCYRNAISLQPNLVDAHNNLGIVLFHLDDLEGAAKELEAALQLGPNDADILCNLASVLKDQGRIGDAMELLGRAIEIAPNSVHVHSNLLFTMIYDPKQTSQEIKQESSRWSAKFVRPLKPMIKPFTNDRDPNRKLRVGYVSSDFSLNVIGHFVLPLLRSHDHESHEIFCYSQGQQPDEGTRQMQQLSNGWMNTAGVRDQDVAEQIRADGIDILVDLKMHTRDNRLGVFAYKPAPVQVTWLGYPGTTGVETIDYRLTDAYLDPPGEHDTDYCEQSIRLPDTFWCYDPLCDIEAGPLPASANGYVTFGCLNNFCKVSDDSLALWSQVMEQLPASRLLLLASPGAHRDRVGRILARRGVKSDRIDFVGRMPRSEYMRQYHRIDIALDTLPYNGHTTSMDGFWMGVPLITLVGKTVVGRAGLSELSNLKLLDWVAHTPEEFVQKSVALGSDVVALQHHRRSLRDRITHSPLMDAKRFTRNIETAYRQMWRTWCEK